MFDFHEKRKIRQLVYSKFFIGTLFLLGLFILHSAYERYTVEREMAQKRDQKAEELEKLSLRASALESKITHLKNERGIEEELRSRFDVVKEGEQVVIILDKEAISNPEPEDASVTPEEIPQDGFKSFMSRLKFWGQ